MGNKGEVIHAFAGLIKDIWTNKYSANPRSFKSTMGKNYSAFSGF